MLLWAIYSDLHTEVDVSGDREGLLALAVALSQPNANEIALDEPPIALDEPPFAITESHPMESIFIEPDDGADPRIRFRREGTTLVISGSNQELSRIVGGPIGDVVAGPESKRAWVRKSISIRRAIPSAGTTLRTVHPSSSVSHRRPKRTPGPACANDP